MPVDAPAILGPAHEVFHHRTDVGDVEPGAVEGTVGRCGRQDLTDRAQSSLAGSVGAFDDRGSCPHADDHAVAAAVERERRFLHDVVDRSGAGGQESGTDPGQQGVAGDVVGGHDDHAVAAAQSNPVLGDRKRLGRAGARRVDLRVRPAGTDVLGELRVTHRQRLEEEPPVVFVLLLFDLGSQFVQHVLEFGDHRIALVHPVPQVFERCQPLPAAVIEFESGNLVDEPIRTGKGGAEDDAGSVPKGRRQSPTFGQLGAGRGGLVVHGQGDPGVPHRIESRSDRKRAGDVQSPEPIGGVAELGTQVELTFASGQFEHLVGRTDRLEGSSTVGTFHQTGDVAIDDLATVGDRDGIDERLAVEETDDVVIIENTGRPGQSQCSTGDDHRLACAEFSAASHRRSVGLIKLPSVLDELAEHPAEVGVEIGTRAGRCGRGNRRQRRGGHARLERRRGLRHRFLRTRAHTEAGGVEGAQRLIERGDIARLGMIGVDRHDLVVVTEDVFDETLEGAFGSDFDEVAGAGVVQGVEPFDELDWRCDLLAEDVDHLGDDSRTGRIEAATHVGNDGDVRCFEVEPPEHLLERLGSGGDDGGVEGMAYRQLNDLGAFGGQCRRGGLDRGRGAADHRLVLGVDVGDHDVPVDGLQRGLDLVQRSEHRSHQPVVVHGNVDHLLAPGGHRLEGIAERHGPGGDQSAVFTQ